MSFADSVLKGLTFAGITMSRSSASEATASRASADPNNDPREILLDAPLVIRQST